MLCVVVGALTSRRWRELSWFKRGVTLMAFIVGLGGLGWGIYASGRHALSLRMAEHAHVILIDWEETYAGRWEVHVPGHRARAPG